MIACAEEPIGPGRRTGILVSIVTSTLPVSGDRELAERYDVAVDRLLRFHPDVIGQMIFLAQQPDFPMGQVLNAYLSLSSTDQPDVARARRAAAALAASDLNERERAHFAAVQAWVDGDWQGAARHLDDLLVQWPTDLLALQVGHQLDFFLGDAANLRDRVARVRLAFDPADPHFGFVLGMQAFGLEEAGSYEAAEAAGLTALDRNPDDVWAVHAVAHAHEMRGRVDDGIRHLRGREADWGDGNLFMVHNWWHLSLFLLEAGRPTDALAVYDEHIHNGGSDGVPLEMLDASALLWRLDLDGAATGDRFAALADAWGGWVDRESWYVFNDLHAVMAFVGAGRLDDARAVIDRLARDVVADVSGSERRSNVMMTATVGLPASRAVLAFGEGRYADAVSALRPIRTTFHRFGGSHAQRDALQRTLLEAAIRAGQYDLARALVSERLSLRDTSVYSWRQQARILEASGRDGAAEARRAAAGYESRFAATLTDVTAG
jgi:tetratricopeptide (TPR) repeat protein